MGETRGWRTRTTETRSLAINTLNHHSFVLLVNRPDMSDLVRAWKPSIAEARMCPSLLYTGWKGVFLVSLPGKEAYIIGIGLGTFRPSEGKHQCLEIQ